MLLYPMGYLLLLEFTNLSNLSGFINLAVFFIFIPFPFSPLGGHLPSIFLSFPAFFTQPKSCFRTSGGSFPPHSPPSSLIHYSFLLSNIEEKPIGLEANETALAIPILPPTEHLIALRSFYWRPSASPPPPSHGTAVTRYVEENFLGDGVGQNGCGWMDGCFGPYQR